MKIAMISEWREPVYGWGQVHVKYLCEWLVQNHWCTIDLFVRSLKDESWKKYKHDESLLNGKRNIFRTWIVSNFFSIPHRIIRLLQITRTLYWRTKKEKYDLIHGHSLLPWIPIKIVSLLTWTPCIYTVHGTPLNDQKQKWLFSLLERILFWYIKYDIVISVSTKIKNYSNINKKIVIVPNWVDINSYDSIKSTKINWWLNFISVWRIDDNKNHIIFIKVISKIQRSDLNKKWFVRNIIWDWPNFENLKRIVFDLNLWKYIKFKWKLFGKSLIREYKNSDVFLLTSLWEGQPLTVLEAMASKLMLIVTDVWDNKYFIDDKNWFIIDAWNENQLLNLMHKIICMPYDKIKAMWITWYEKVKKHTWIEVIKMNYDQYLYLYNHS